MEKDCPAPHCGDSELREDLREHSGAQHSVGPEQEICQCLQNERVHWPGDEDGVRLER